MAELHVELLENDTDDVRNNIEHRENELKILREEKVNGILIRAKAKWEVEGERNTKFFCNLENKNFTDKIIPKLMLENGQVIQDPKLILNEQKLFIKIYTRARVPAQKIFIEIFSLMITIPSLVNLVRTI